MAEVKPFRGVSYNSARFKNIEEYTAPLFDVITPRQRQHLYSLPYNSVHLSVPEGEAAPEKARQAYLSWKKEGILVQDQEPAFYAYYQYFCISGSTEEICRKGFIGMLRVYDWSEKVLMRHENTIPKAVNDRIDLLRTTRLHVSPTHGLYDDPYLQIETILDQYINDPVLQIEDYQGVREVVARVDDPEDIAFIQKVLADKQIILADGHHRYEASLQLMHETRQPAYHMMYFSNLQAKGLRILPTHRIIKKLPSYSTEHLLERISEYFTIKSVDNYSDIPEIIFGKPYAFGLLLPDRSVKIRLKPGLEKEVQWSFPEKVKEVSLTVMHYYLIEKVLGIPGLKQRSSPDIEYERDFVECIHKIETKEAQMAIITQPIAIETVKEVCLSGYTLPQKSTYFYPKIVTGLVFAEND